MDTSAASRRRAGVEPPAPSLLSSIVGHIRAMEEHLASAVATLTDLATWDSSTSNHTGVQAAVDELRQQHDDWQRGMLTHLQSLWFAETAVYNDYRQKMERTLAVRHRAELDHTFPRLALDPGTKSARAQESEADVLARVGGSQEQLRFVNHLTALGFDLDVGNSRQQLLITRQLNERTVFDQQVLKHTARLMEAKRIDMAKLQGLLQRTEQALNSMLAVVDKKIAAAHQLAATANVYGSHRGSGSIVPPIGGGGSAGGSQPASARPSRPATGSTAMKPATRPASGASHLV